MRALLIAGLVAVTLGQSPASFGIFATAGDVGGPTIKGATAFDPATRQYTITGSGANMWAKADQFQYVWKEITGNFTAAATVQFVGKGADHRKAGIVVRQSLDTDAVYADVVVHGNGMPALQWRSKKGDDTDTFDLPVEGPGTFRIKLVRTGARIQMFVMKNGTEPKEIGSTQVTFQGPVLVGLGVCSHDPAVSETAIFSDVSVEATPPAAQKLP
jgi:TolB protein